MILEPLQNWVNVWTCWQHLLALFLCHFLQLTNKSGQLNPKQGNHLFTCLFLWMEIIWMEEKMWRLWCRLRLQWKNDATHFGKQSHWIKQLDQNNFDIANTNVWPIWLSDSCFSTKLAKKWSKRNNVFFKLNHDWLGKDDLNPSYSKIMDDKSTCEKGLTGVKSISLFFVLLDPIANTFSLYILYN